MNNIDKSKNSPQKGSDVLEEGSEISASQIILESNLESSTGSTIPEQQRESFENPDLTASIISNKPQDISKKNKKQKGILPETSLQSSQRPNEPQRVNIELSENNKDKNKAAKPSGRQDFTTLFSERQRGSGIWLLKTIVGSSQN